MICDLGLRTLYSALILLLCLLASTAPAQTSPNIGAGLTYSNPYQLATEAGKVYDFCRDPRPGAGQ